MIPLNRRSVDAEAEPLACGIEASNIVEETPPYCLLSKLKRLASSQLELAPIHKQRPLQAEAPVNRSVRTAA
jgi:hypothetical protein